eukprot:8381062-Pyramimonas_sp.AAC.1
MDWPPTAMHLDRCTPRCRMYSRWADAHHKRAEAEIIEYEKTGYEKQCRKQIMAVTVDESDESSFEVEEETELDFAADQEGEHTHNVDEVSGREEERGSNRTGICCWATRPYVPDEGTPFGKHYLLIDGDLPLPKEKQISEEAMMTLWPSHEDIGGSAQIGLEHEEL